MDVKVFNRKMGLLWDDFFTPAMVSQGCFTELIPAGCEYGTINALFKFYKEPETTTATAYGFPDISDLQLRDTVAKTMHF